MRKKIAWMLIFCMMLSTGSVMAAYFSDIYDGNWNWAKESVEDMNNKGIITGFSDGTFRPAEGVQKLHALIMIARILGVNEPENAKYVELAQETYETILFPFDITNKREVAYLLYKGILHPEELIHYIAPSKANEILKRYEAAVLLTKTLGKEKAVKSKMMWILPYDDVADIPEYAKPYVECVKNEKINGKSIMGGISETEFGPKLSVNRATMAVMLHRVMQKTKEIEQVAVGTIIKIDKGVPSITIKNVIDVEKTYTINDNVLLRLDGQSIQLGDLTGNESVKVTVKADKVYMIEALSPNIDETVEGIITYISSTSSSNKRIKIQVQEDDKELEKEYKIDDDTVIVYKEKTSSFKYIDKYDYATTVEVKNGIVKRIEVEPKKREVDGVVEEVILEPTVMIRVKLDDDDTVEEYEVKDNISVRKNDRVSDLRSIRIGDEVELTLEYDKVRKIDAESVRKSEDGTIEEIVISKTPSIKVKKKGEIQSYNVAWDVEIKIDDRYTHDEKSDNAGKPFDLYDLRLGYPVELTLDSDVVIKIEAKTMGQTKQITGSVESVNESYRVMTVAIADTLTGETTSQQIFIKDIARIIDSNTSKTMDLDDVEIGDIVTVIGTTDAGVFEANTIVVISR